MPGLARQPVYFFLQTYFAISHHGSTGIYELSLFATGFKHLERAEEESALGLGCRSMDLGRTE